MQVQGISSTEQEDLLVQHAVLSFVLREHPTLLSAAEVASEIGPGDTMDRALDDLRRGGLLRREGETILPTRAALFFDRLWS